MDFSVFGSSMGDCRVNISLVDPTVLVSITKTYWSNGAWVSLLTCLKYVSIFSSSLACSAFLATSLHPFLLLQLQP